MLIGLGLIALCFFAIYAVMVAQVTSRLGRSIFYYLLYSALMSVVLKRSNCRL